MRERKEREILYPWQERYLSDLGLTRLSRELGSFGSSVLVLPGTEGVLSDWRENKPPATLNVVVVSPNEGGLPLRLMSYLLEAVQAVQSLRQNGIDIQRLRVINPCYLNVYCNGGNLDYQRNYGDNLIEGFAGWVREKFPDLSDVNFILDQGYPFDGKNERYLAYAKDLWEKIAQDFELWLAIRNRAGRYISYITDVEDMTALYVAAHPLAWQYDSLPKGNIFQERETPGVINWMPQSEMPYLFAMERAGIPVLDLERMPVAVVSRRHVFAPYHFLIKEEPVLRLDFSHEPTEIQNFLTALRRSPFYGRDKFPPIHDCYGHLLRWLQDQRRRRPHCSS